MITPRKPILYKYFHELIEDNLMVYARSIRFLNYIYVPKDWQVELINLKGSPVKLTFLTEVNALQTDQDTAQVSSWNWVPLAKQVMTGKISSPVGASDLPEDIG